LKWFLRATSGAWTRIDTGSHVRISTAQPAAIEQLVKEITGEPSPVFAMSLGTPGAYRKLTLQAMTPKGSVLGYLKLPITAGATARVRTEASALQLLSTSRDLAGLVPKLLFSGELGGHFVLFQTAGPGKAGSATYNSVHSAFLARLGTLRSCGRHAGDVLAQVASEWTDSELSKFPDWKILGESALECAYIHLTDEISCGLTHGDFAPWNTRRFDNHLYVFDWESMSDRNPIIWDQFHFKAQVYSLLKNAGSPRQVFALGPGLPDAQTLGLLLLYLLRSSASLTQDQGSPDNPGVTCRARWISCLLR
jgi:hypothetical protein